MKIHTFVRDTKLMEENERNAIAKRERYLKWQRQIADSEKEETQEVQAEEKEKKALYFDFS